MTIRTAARLAEIAAAHLDADAARRWLALLRPAAQLVPAGPDAPVVARLGGTPELPPGTEWPQWPGEGPLSFVVELDLAALAATGVDVGLTLPAEGRLLGFFFEPDGDSPVVLTGDPDTLPGSRLLHVTGTGPAADPVAELAATPSLTWPDEEHPALREAGLDDLPDSWWEALEDLRAEDVESDSFGRQVGGWASPVQAPVELETAELRLGAATYDDVHEEEALRWRLLLQVDSDWAAGTAWEPATCLYWLARTDGTGPIRVPGDIGFTWQC
ncbi:YwqG family protein [Microvirga sp. 0TCS3.31]